ncbi:effector-associated constant component EACC1 [Streptomyces sp. NPDC001076]
MTEAFTASPELKLALSGEDVETELLALRDWLDLEDVLRGRVDVRRRMMQPGHMGAGFDVLMVALGSGGAGAVLRLVP